MQSRRHETEKAPAAATAPAEAKKPSPMQEAIKLASGLAKINKREDDYIGNAKVRYQTERDKLLAGASSAAKRIIAAAESDADEGDAA